MTYSREGILQPFLVEVPPPENEGYHHCGQPLHVLRRDRMGYPTLKCHRCDEVVHTEPIKAALAAKVDRAKPWRR